MNKTDIIEVLKAKKKLGPLTPEELDLARYQLELQECLIQDSVDETLIAYDWIWFLGIEGIGFAQAALERAEQKAESVIDYIMAIEKWLYLAEMPGAPKEDFVQRAMKLQLHAEGMADDAEEFSKCACTRVKFKGPDHNALAWALMKKAEAVCEHSWDPDSIVLYWVVSLGYDGYCEAKRFMDSLVSDSDKNKNLHFYIPYHFWNRVNPG